MSPKSHLSNKETVIVYWKGVKMNCTGLANVELLTLLTPWATTWVVAKVCKIQKVSKFAQIFSKIAHFSECKNVYICTLAIVTV